LVESKDAPSPVAAVVAVGRLLPQMASAAIAASALGYFVGWQEASSYFSELGAPWAVPMLSPLRLLQMSASIVVPMAFFAFISVDWLVKGRTSAQQLSRLARFTVISEKWLSPRAVYWCSTFGALAFAISAGWTIGELIARLSADRLEWSGRHVGLLYVLVLFGFFYAPTQVGDARGWFDRKSAALPCAQWVGYEATCDWRLVEVIGSSALLMCRGAPEGSPAFRVVAMTDITVAEPPAKK
jgi:hypothetical protein